MEILVCFFLLFLPLSNFYWTINFEQGVLVNQLSMVMFLLVFSMDFTNSSTKNSAAGLFGGTVPLPKYTRASTMYLVELSQIIMIFIPYFFGLDGIYILKGQRPRNPTNCSSIAKYVPGLYRDLQFSKRISQIFLTGANLSVFLRSSLVPLSSNLRQFIRNLKCLSLMPFIVRHSMYYQT